MRHNVRYIKTSPSPSQWNERIQRLLGYNNSSLHQQNTKRRCETQDARPRFQLPSLSRSVERRYGSDRLIQNYIMPPPPIGFEHVTSCYSNTCHKPFFETRPLQVQTMEYECGKYFSNEQQLNKTVCTKCFYSCKLRLYGVFLHSSESNCKV